MATQTEQMVATIPIYHTAGAKKKNKVKSNPQRIMSETITREEERSRRFLMNVQTLQTLKIKLTKKLRNDSVNKSLTSFIKLSGIWMMFSRWNIIAIEAMLKMATVIRFAPKTELKYFRADSISPLWTLIVINLPAMEFSAVVISCAQLTKLLASPTKPQASAPNFSTINGVRKKVIPSPTAKEKNCAMLLMKKRFFSDICYPGSKCAIPFKRVEWKKSAPVKESELAEIDFFRLFHTEQFQHEECSLAIVLQKLLFH